MFRTQYDDHNRVYSNAGSRVAPVYSPVIDKEGRLDLEESGQENLYEYIQSFKDSVDINVILRRFAAGDTSALARRQGMFLDTTQMPKTYAEMLNTVIAAENYFESLPVDVRSKFDHSFSVFMNEFGSADFAEKLGLNAQQADTVSQNIQSEVTADE